MEKRFKKEKNLSQSHKKEIDSFVEEKDEVHDETPLEHISHVYTNIQSKSVLQNSILLACVLFILFFFAGWAMPRVFSFRLDMQSVFQKLTHPALISGNIEEKIPEGDMDILILWRGGSENDAPDLTDSIIYGHYDIAEPMSLSALSIPRDLMVQSKILGRVKINSVYSWVKNSLSEDEAFTHLLETVSDIVGRDIQYYAMIDFAGFRKLIDQLGGIEIDVPERLYDNEYPTKNWWYTVVDIPAGLQHFDGDKALKYARSRHTTSDFDRSKRQQLVITALREKLLTLDVLSSPKKIQGIYETLQSSVQTNLSLSQMFQLAKNLSKTPKENIIGHSLDNTCFEALRLCNPGGLLYTPDRNIFNGASVLLPKKATVNSLAAYENIRLFVQVFTDYPTLLREFPLTVVNASGRTNLALSVALKLRSIGVPVDERQIRNQKEKSDKTFIRYNSLIIKPENILLHAIVSIFWLEAREATVEERIGMVGSYELVLGLDSWLYFK